MKKTTTPIKIVLPCLVIGLAAGAWAFKRHAPTKETPQAILTALPKPTGNAMSDKQITKWTEAVRRKQDDVKAWGNLGDALMQKARETADVAYYMHAEKAYDQALVHDPKYVPALIGKAWVNGGRHEFEQSIAWANKALALEPNNEDAFGLLGDADVEMGNYDLAYTHYQKMLDTRPDTSSYSRGAHLLFLTGDFRKAVLLMAKAIYAGAPYAENTAWCRAQLGQMLFNNGNILAADNTLAAGLQKSPNNYHLLVTMGKVKTAQKDYNAAIDCYRKAIAITPQHDAVVALGDLYALTGKKDEAEKQYALVETIHKLNKVNGVRGDMQIAQFYADHDRNLPEALREVEAEYKTRKNVYVADTLAWCFYKNGRYQDALNMSQEALSQKTPDARFLFHNAMINLKLGNRQDAQHLFFRALNLNPGFSPIDAPVAAAMIQELGSGHALQQASAQTSPVTTTKTR